MLKYGLIVFSVLISAVSASEINVYIWNPLPIIGGLGTFGHAAISVDSSYLSFHKGHATTPEADKASSADNVFKLNSSRLNVDKMKAKIAEFLQQTDQYKLFSKNCSFTVAQVLLAGGMQLGDINNWGAIDAPTPYRLRDELLSQFVSSATYLIVVGALGNTERKTLLALKDKTGFHLISEGSWWKEHCVVSRVSGRGL